MKRLKGIAKKDPKVQLNQVQDLVKAPYQTVINQMVNDYTQLGLATVLQNM